MLRPHVRRAHAHTNVDKQSHTHIFKEGKNNNTSSHADAYLSPWCIITLCKSYTVSSFSFVYGAMSRPFRGKFTCVLILLRAVVVQLNRFKTMQRTYATQSDRHA